MLQTNLQEDKEKYNTSDEECKEIEKNQLLKISNFLERYKQDIDLSLFNASNAIIDFIKDKCDYSKLSNYEKGQNGPLNIYKEDLSLNLALIAYSDNSDNF